MFILSPKSKKPHLARNPSTIECALNASIIKTDATNNTPLDPCTHKISVRGSFSPSKQQPVKNMKITSSEFKEIGNPWFTIGFYRYLANLNLTCWKLLIKRDARFYTMIYQIIETVLTIAVLGFLQYKYYALFNDPTIYFIVGSCDLLFLVIIGIILCLQLRRLLIHREQAALFDFIYIFALFFAALVSLYLTIILVMKEIYIAWLLLICLFCITLIENINMMAWILFLPIIGFVLMFEFAIRLITCKLKCPEKIPIIKEYRYRLFEYNSISYAENKCMICLNEYMENELISSLSCHDSHIFHENCIEEWLKKQDSCPICRKAVEFKI